VVFLAALCFSSPAYRLMIPIHILILRRGRNFTICTIGESHQSPFKEIGNLKMGSALTVQRCKTANSNVFDWQCLLDWFRIVYFLFCIFNLSNSPNFFRFSLYVCRLMYFCAFFFSIISNIILSYLPVHWFVQHQTL